MKKLILLDIDGVLNPNASSYTPSHAEVSGFHVWESFKLYRSNHPEFFEGQQPFVNEYDIQFSPEILDKIQALSFENENVEIAFLSDWGNSAVSLFVKKTGMFTAKEWRSFEKFDPETLWIGEQLVGSWWKHHVLENILNEDSNRHVVFVDDRAMHVKGHVDYARITELLVENHPNLMVVAPNGAAGISRHELKELLHHEFFENKVFTNEQIVESKPYGVQHNYLNSQTGY